MTDKPSKEQLESYFKNSRKYFDSLAEHYKKSDPVYYNTVMKPVMYKNYFSKSSSTSPKRPVFAGVIAVLLVAVGAAIAIFFAASESTNVNTVETRQSQKVEAVQERQEEIVKDTARTVRQRIPLKKDTTGERRLKETKAERIR